MKTINLLRYAILIAVLLVPGELMFSQNGNGRGRAGNGNICLQSIPNLTADQQKQIEALNVSHQQAMDQLRNERRSVTDVNSKAVTRTKMIQLRETHRADVNKLLTAEQQQVYNSMNSRSANGDNMGSHQRKNGKGNGKMGNKGSCCCR